MLSDLKKILWLLLFLPQLVVAQEIYFNTLPVFILIILSLKSLQILMEIFDILWTESEPTAQSPIYISPIQVTENTSPNSISNIPTNPPTTYYKYIWKAPLVTIPKTRIVKAALFNNQIQLSNVFYQEYFIGQNLGEIQLPIFSIIGDSLDWFGYEEGIYIPGKDYDDDPNIWQPGNYYNTGSDWAKTMSLNFYKTKIGFFNNILL